jgi:hypothetical protein
MAAVKTAGEENGEQEVVYKPLHRASWRKASKCDGPNARLTYIRNNQHSDPDDEEFAGTGDEEPTNDVRLPSTFVHSPA